LLPFVHSHRVESRAMKGTFFETLCARAGWTIIETIDNSASKEVGFYVLK
jgi:hypothetical protein